MTRAAVLAVPVFTLALLASACSTGGSSPNTPTVAAVVSPTPSNTSPARTPIPGLPAGLPELVVGAALDKDNIQLARLTFYQQIACKADQNPHVGGDPPVCRDNEPDGTSVIVLPATQCQGDWVRPEQVPDVYLAALRIEKPRLVAAYTPKLRPASFGGGFAADTVLVFQTGDAAADAVALHVKSGRVVWVQAACTSVADLIAPDDVDAFILEPTGIAARDATPATETPPAAPDEPTPDAAG
jgi:hypothetical protein